MTKRILIVIAILLGCGVALADTWNTGVPSATHQIKNDIPKMQQNFSYLYNMFKNHYGSLDNSTTANLADSFAYVDPTCADQGVVGCSSVRSVKDWIDAYSGKYGILYFPNTGTTTTYQFKTGANVQDNLLVMVEPGVRVDTSYSICDGGSAYTWTLHTGSIYKLNQTIPAPTRVLEGNVEMTDMTTVAAMTGVSQWAYDNSVLYVWTSGAVDPDTLASGTLESVVKVQIDSVADIPPFKWIESDSIVTFGYSPTVRADWWGDDNVSIHSAWSSITSGTVLLTPERSYTGIVTIPATLTQKTLDGQGACINNGNLIVNLSKDITVKRLNVDGYGEINGCYSCVFDDITFEEDCALFSGTRKAGYTLTLTDGPTDTPYTGFGAYWNVFKHIKAHGAILAPGAYTTEADENNTGVNANSFYDCRIKSALTSGTGDLHDNDNASIRIIDSLGTDTSNNSQGNMFIGGDLSDSHYLVKNENTYPFYVKGTYAENYSHTHTGEVQFTDSYVYTARTSAGDNDTKHNPNVLFNTSNRGTHGYGFDGANDLFGNPGLAIWEYNSIAEGYIAGEIGGGSTYDQCGSGSGGVAGSSLTMALDPDSLAPTIDNVVVKAVGGTAGPCSVRFIAKYKAGDGEGNVGATMLVKGTGWSDTRVGFNGDAGSDNAMHGTKSATQYEIIAGATGISTNGSNKPYAEITVDTGATIYIAGVTMSRGKMTTLQQSYMPPRHEAQSNTGPPTTGYWRSGALVWNTAGDSYVEDTRTIMGTPIGWLCTGTGTFGGSAPTFRELGQIGFRTVEAANLGAVKSQRIGEIAGTMDENGTITGVYFAIDDNGTTWLKLSN